MAPSEEGVTQGIDLLPVSWCDSILRLRLVCAESLLDAIDRKRAGTMTFLSYWGWFTRLASGIIRLMSKQCYECGSVTNGEEGYCDACGSRSWRELPNQLELKMLNWLSLLLMLGAIGFSYWLLVWPILTK